MVGNTKQPTFKQRVEALQAMDTDSWKTFYSNSFMAMEKVVPFDKKKDDLDYRFRWVLKNVKQPIPQIPSQFLDIGSHNGLLCHAMEKKGYEVHGMDVSEEACKSARVNVPNGTFMTGFADQEIPCKDNTFSVVASLEVIEHVKDLDKMITEVKRVLKPGGMFLFTTPVGHAYDCNEHIRHFDWYALHNYIEKEFNNFNICRIYKINEHDQAGRLLFAVKGWKDVEPRS